MPMELDLKEPLKMDNVMVNASRRKAKEGVRFEGSYSQDRRDGKFIEKDRNGVL